MSIGVTSGVTIAGSFVVAVAINLIAASAQTTAAQKSQPDGQWIMASKNYANTRFSELNQITADNVKSLKVDWTFSTGVNTGHEEAPLVVGTTMYLPTPFPNVLYALD